MAWGQEEEEQPSPSHTAHSPRHCLSRRGSFALPEVGCSEGGSSPVLAPSWAPHIYVAESQESQESQEEEEDEESVSAAVEAVVGSPHQNQNQADPSSYSGGGDHTHTHTGEYDSDDEDGEDAFRC